MSFTIEYSNIIRIPIRIFEYRFRFSLTSLVIIYYNRLLFTPELVIVIYRPIDAVVFGCFRNRMGHI